ncbi:A/G-specific adenine glycosylase [Ottowia thiooxydans]|uniref:A/G-specific adenine glycosylase n=1 Tax=Ottowia thiooxydans TaxID=219182 RepID=UPI0004125A2B|nr:A/G-specific adenine glycosylase [Ottowia thiooxydans]
MKGAGKAFSDRIIVWQGSHGRHGLPWQATRDPYRVWLSEIMLQQTQVSTVLDYYPRFLAQFADVAALAAASENEVMALWSGLGYYSRARNLHRCAQEVVSRFGGQFPSSAELLQSLPGIGRSTAAAIAAFCFGERAAILDGNVKRVLTRYLGIADDLAVSANERALWLRAEELLPEASTHQTMPIYTQGLMDLGATVCTLRRPVCLVCPLSADCVAAHEGKPERYPVKTRRVKRSRMDLWLLHVLDPEGRVGLAQRPAPGIWAGLHCLPVSASLEELMSQLPLAVQGHAIEHTPFVHVLTHRDLHLHVVTAHLDSAALDGLSVEAIEWFDERQWQAKGLPAPVRRFLEGSLVERV